MNRSDPLHSWDGTAPPEEPDPVPATQPEPSPVVYHRVTLRSPTHAWTHVIQDIWPLLAEAEANGWSWSVK